MPLVPGSRLGPFEIVAPLGAGGMGEVYRARDTRLERTVAIKVLPESLAGDPQFRERFDREARAISQLTHPNICTLHDVGEHAGTAFLVMEFLEGETLADRMARAASKGPGLPHAEALSIAIQIAEALAAAHRAGIVHRDLKPGNVFLVGRGGPSGPALAKLLDFGLAKATVPAVVPSGGSMLPTTPPQALTAQGTILGTFQYMAPEQIEGAEADARSDIFAFGCVLHEMLTGQKAFEGRTHASLIAAILEREAPLVTTLQPGAPPLVDAIVRKCLAKKPDDRWQSAADLGSALRWAADGAGAAASSTAAAPQPVRRSGARGVALAVGTVVVFAIGAFVGWRYVSRPTAPPAAVRFEVTPPTGVTLSPAPVASAAQLALSSDGRRLVFVAAAGRGVSQLWVRPLDDVQARPLAGTEGASFPFWSPDGRYIGFFAGGKLKKVDTAGGAPEVLCNAAGGRGGAWGPDGTIVFTGEPNSPMSQVAAAGGTVRPATVLNRDLGVTANNWPQFLPDGRRFLYYQRSLKPEHTGIYVASLDSADTTRVIGSTGAGLYGSGHLLFVRDGILFAQPFDDRALRTTGEAARIADHVGYFSASLGYTAVTVSPAGALATGPSVAGTTSLQWRDRDGTARGSLIAPAVYRSPRLSPDQKRVALATWDPETGQNDIWVIDLALRNPSRLTFDPANDWFPAWAPDGSRIFFGSTRSGTTTIFRKDGSEPEQVFLGTASNATYPNDTSRDGRFLSYTQSSPRAYDLGVVPLSGDAKLIPFLASPFNEVQGRFAPNSKWLSYASDESGRFEVYVRPFPAASGQSLISVAGGMQPEWRRDGKELFYISADGKLMAVPVTTDGATFSAGVPRALFNVQAPEQTPPYPTDYAVTADGQRFLVNTVADQAERAPLTVILNWVSALKK
ncbi:MAG: hypothetical protein A3J29_03005 [Acidobacteria bacterium RIFCSPLOWO2_12_FULL_67_14b]|nr:MAG: hypothetical protein A3J29_03005 [Acidobacteria bacterium RIFCSPLOWO2_12_FULL_67_14b]